MFAPLPTSPADQTDLSLHFFGRRKPEKLDILGVELGEDRQRTPQEIQEIKEKISLIARVFSRNYNIEVLPSPDGGWACGLSPEAAEQANRYLTGELKDLNSLPADAFRPKQIFYDAGEIENRPEDELLGVIRHEVGHANNSDYRSFIEGQRLAIEQGNLPTTWAGIHNALEDPWVNNIEIAGSEVVRRKMAVLYARRLPEIVELINTQPATHQLGLNIVHYWLKGESLPTLQNPDVKAAFEKIKPYVDQYFQGKTARDNFENLKTNIWQHVRPLEERALNDEQLKEMARQAGNSKLGKEQEQKGKSPPGKGTSKGSSSQGGQDPAQEGQTGSHGGGWLNRIKKALGFGDQDEKKRGNGGKGSQDKNSSAQNEASVRKAIEKAASPEFRKEMKRQLASQAKELNKRSAQDRNLADDIDLDKLSPETLAELKKLAKELEPAARDALEKLARKNLDTKQAEQLRKDAPQHLKVEKDPERGEYRTELNAPPDEKKVDEIREKLAEFDKGQASAAAQAAEAASAAEAHRQQELVARQREEAIKQEMLRNGFNPDERELFARFKALESSMQASIANFIKILDRYLPKKETFEYGGEFYTGSRLNQKSINERAPTKDYRIFKRREAVESHEPRMFVQLLIDNSGSMAGEKMAESLKTAIFWARVLEKFEIPFAIKFFGSQVEPVLAFDQDYDDPRQRVKPNIIKQADAMGGSTDMGTPLRMANDEMLLAKRKFTGSYGAVFVISDSGANQGMVGAQLQNYIKEMQKNFLVMNFILTHSSGEVDLARGYFGEKNVIAPAKFTDLPNESFKVLRVTLERVMKVYRPA